MNRSDLSAELKRSGVRSDSYSLTGDKNEAYVLEHTRDGWFTYYSERGNRNDDARFDTESEACSFFLKWVLMDTSNRT